MIDLEDGPVCAVDSLGDVLIDRDRDDRNVVWCRGPGPELSWSCPVLARIDDEFALGSRAGGVRNPDRVFPFRIADQIADSTQTGALGG